MKLVEDTYIAPRGRKTRVSGTSVYRLVCGRPLAGKSLKGNASGRENVNRISYPSLKTQTTNDTYN